MTHTSKVTYRHKFFDSIPEGSDILKLPHVVACLEKFTKDKGIGPAHWDQNVIALIEKIIEKGPEVFLKDELDSVVPHKGAYAAIPIVDETHHQLQLLLLCICSIIARPSGVEGLFNEEDVRHARRFNPILQHAIREAYYKPEESSRPVVVSQAPRSTFLSGLFRFVTSYFKGGGAGQSVPRNQASESSSSLRKGSS